MKKFPETGKQFIFALIIFMVVVYIGVVPAYSAGRGVVVEEGFLCAYGNGFVGGSHNSYKVSSFILHFGLRAHAVLPSLIPDTGGRLLIYLEPQYNIVTHPSGNYEFGIGVGLEYRFPLSDNLYAYLLAGSGLHYISFHSRNQSGGFNFNDNFGTGLYIKVSKSAFINAGFRFRHISNADLNKPNEGINSYLFVLGISRFFN